MSNYTFKTYLEYVASYEDLCEYLSDKFTSDIQHNLKIINEFGKFHYELIGIIELENNKREYKKFDVYNYIANFPHNIHEYYDKSAKRLNIEIILYHYIVFGYTNKLYLLTIKNCKEIVEQMLIKLSNYVPVHIYILCYNEELLIENTIKHYLERFPSCKITIMDNYSEDNSVNIATTHGCEIHYWKSEVIDQIKYLELKNNIWKCNKKGWVIVCDMDELLEINYDELIKENDRGTTIIKTQGINIVGESKCKNLSDICLRSLTRGFKDNKYSKSVCFNVEKITDINYSPGCHICKPNGKVFYSDRIYILKHLNFLGEQYYIWKILERYKRKTDDAKKKGWSVHYTNNIDSIKRNYRECFKKTLTTLKT